MHPKYEFYEFWWHFQLRGRFENQENYIKGEFGDILDSWKNPGMHPKYEFYEFCWQFQLRARFENHI